MMDPANLRTAAGWLVEADGLVVAAGAGMGVDSGLPDFRGDTGFWKAYPALAQAGLRFVDVASPRAFATTPRQAWGFYGHRLALYRRTVPHAGFGMLLRWAARMPCGVGAFTSNVDGQFQKAGFGEQGVAECHGSLLHLQCSRPCSESLWPADALQPQVDEDRCEWVGDLPSCPSCGALARPNVLMFGDAHWVSMRSDTQQHRLEHWLGSLRRPVVVELGAGLDVPTVRHFSQAVVNGLAGRLIRINPRDCGVDRGRHAAKQVALAAGALEALMGLDRCRVELEGWG